jgi:VWFA-related protein
MVRKTVSIIAVVGAAALWMVGLAKGQGAATATVQTGPTNGDRTTLIRSTTRLVQVSVIVTDKKGEPLTGLSKEDFTVLDEAKTQEIAFFSAEAPKASGVTTPKLPPNAFTNRFDLKGQDPGTITVVLFDSLNTSVQDQGWVRNQVIKFLKSVKPQDHVAVYGLAQELLILHEFTQNALALVEAANRFQPKESALYDASNPTDFNLPAMGDPGWTKFQAAMSRSDPQTTLDAINRRGELTANALEVIAEHVATIPGRKNLVWVSGAIPFTILTESFESPSRQGGTTGPYTLAAARALNRANMAVYPVDASGVVTNAAMDPSNPNDLKCIDCIPNGPTPKSGMFVRENNLTSERMLADQTGGLAFYGTNDIGKVMKRAFDDGRYAYTIGFYPNHGQWDGKYRKIKIQVKAAGAQLRYRGGYFAEAEHADSEAQAKADLEEAALSPLDATRLGVIVSGKVSGPVSERKVELHVALDPKQLLLKNVEQHEKGAVDLYFVQRNAKGETVAAESQRIGLNLEEKQYEYLSQAGLILARHLRIEPESSELRVLVRDAGSQALGSVTMPVSALLVAENGSGATAPKMGTPKYTLQNK